MAHWIIEDKGFGGCYYRCSNCGEFYWDVASTNIGQWGQCIRCNAPINAENEYLEDVVKVRKPDDTRVKSLEDRLFLLTGCKCFGRMDVMDGTCVDCIINVPDLSNRCSKFSKEYDKWHMSGVKEE